MMIERLRQAKWRPILGQIAMTHLPARVHAGIRTTSGGDGVRTRLQTRQSGLDRTLHRWLIGLSLPPGKRRAIIFDFQGISGHAPRLT